MIISSSPRSPFLRYQKNSQKENAQFFRDRDSTLSALSIATIVTIVTIVTEAGDRSGSLITARAALRQGRKVFIPDPLLHGAALAWPDQLEALGGIRFRRPEDLLPYLSVARSQISPETFGNQSGYFFVSLS